MEAELLKQLVKNTAPKSSTLIILSSNETNFTTNFSPSIELDENKSYEIAFLGLETYYVMPNIDLHNNVFSIKRGVDKSKKGWVEIIIPVGTYGMKELNHEINKIIKGKGFEKVLTLTPNKATFTCEMTIEEGFRVRFGKQGGLKDVLGFSEPSYQTGVHIAEKPINIISINSIVVKTDITTGSYVDDSAASAIYSFFPNVSPGHKIIEKAGHLVYLPVYPQDKINSITVKLTDQDGKKLNLRGEKLTLRFHLRGV